MTRPSRNAGIFGTEDLHLPFLITALAIALLSGFVLAIALPVEAALGRAGTGWVARAQVHGHLQAVGFIGLFIMGVAHRLVPRLAGRPLPFPSLVAPSFWLVAGGVLLRALAQPLADQPAFAVLMAGAGWAEAAGAFCFAANIVALSAPRVMHHEYAALLAGGAGWFAVQGILGAIWLTQLAAEGGTALPADRNGVLLAMQVLGFHVAFLLGVGVRSFPTFFGAGRVSPRSAIIGATALHGGVGLIALEAIAGPWLAVEHVAGIATGAGVLWLGSLTRWWQLPSRLRPASRPFAWTLQPAMAWLALAGVLLIGFAVDGLASGSPADPRGADSVRHIIEIGVVLLAIVGMAQMVLPEFASERLRGPQARWRSVLFGVALSLAVVLRAGARFAAPPLSAEVAFWLMALAGILALATIAAFAVLFARSVRRHRVLVSQMTIPLADAQR